MSLFTELTQASQFRCHQFLEKKSRQPVIPEVKKALIFEELSDKQDVPIAFLPSPKVLLLIPDFPCRFLCPKLGEKREMIP